MTSQDAAPKGRSSQDLEPAAPAPCAAGTAGSAPVSQSSKIVGIPSPMTEAEIRENNRYETFLRNLLDAW